MTEQNSVVSIGCDIALAYFAPQLSPYPGNANWAKWEDPLRVEKATTRFSIKAVFSSKLISVLELIKRKQITARLLSKAIN